MGMALNHITRSGEDFALNISNGEIVVLKMLMTIMM